MAGKYNKASLIGSGTFGKVWLVRHLSSGRRYVIKEVSVGALNAKERQQTLTEVEVLARCRHVNVIRYREAFLEDSVLNIVMSYADGGDLHGRIQKQHGSHFPEPVILDWFVQICFALRYIHGLHIVHRDLKTQNIFLSGDNLIKVGDFGIARVLSSTTDHATTAVGTPYYLSPEICQQMPYNQKSDMWSLGCVLYELCCLTHPFDGQNLAALVIKILNGTYKPIPSHYSAILEDLISVLLRGQAETRPSAEQVLWIPALQKYVTGHVNRSAAMTPRVTKTPSPVVTSKRQVDSPEADKENIKPNSMVKRSRCHSQSTPKAEAVVDRPRLANSAECNRQSLTKDNKGVAPTLSLYKQVLRRAHGSPARAKSAKGSSTRPSISSKTYRVRQGRSPVLLEHYKSPGRKRSKMFTASECGVTGGEQVGCKAGVECLEAKEEVGEQRDSVREYVSVHGPYTVHEMVSDHDPAIFHKISVHDSNEVREEVSFHDPSKKKVSNHDPQSVHDPTIFHKVCEQVSMHDPTIVCDHTSVGDSTNVHDPTTVLDPTTLHNQTTAHDPTAINDPITACDPTAIHNPITARDPTTIHDPTNARDPTTIHDPTNARDPTIRDPPTVPEQLYAHLCLTQDAAFPLMEDLRHGLEEQLGLEQLARLLQVALGCRRRAAPFDQLLEQFEPTQRAALPRLLILLQLETICRM